LRSLIRFLPLLALCASPVSLRAELPAACEGRVGRVTIRSDVETRDSEQLLVAARVRVGSPVLDEDLQRGLRALRASGASTVEVFCQPLDGEALDGDRPLEIVFVLRGAVQVESVDLSGDLGLKRRDLVDLVPQKVNEPLVEDRVIRGVYRLQDRLNENGFLSARVRIDIEIDEEAKRAVVGYEIDAGSRFEIDEVSFRGELDPALDAGLRERIRQKSGKSYSRLAIRSEPERLESWLRQQGYLRAIVGEAEETIDTEGARVDLVYAVDRGPSIEIVVEGAERKKLEKKGLLPFLDGAGFDDALVVQSRNAIKRYFQARGFYDVEVNSSQERSEGEILLTLTVDRGAEYVVEKVEISGNEVVADDDLAPRIETTGKRFLARGSGHLVDETLDADLQNLRSFYALSGFPSAEIGPPAVARDDAALMVEIPVVEGERRRVVSVEFEGVENLGDEIVGAEFLIRPGGPYHPLLLDESVNSIRAIYQEQGYASVGIDPELDWSADQDLVDVIFHINEGPRTVVEGILIRGNQKTKREIVRRAMELESGDPVSARSLLEVQRRLYGLGIFSGVRVNTVPGTPYSSGRDVLVTLDEGKRSRVTYGVGYDSEDGVRGLFGYTRNNMFGRGVSARFDLQASERDRQARLLVRQPYVGLTEVPIRYSLFRVEEEQESFDSQRQGVQVEASRRLGHSQWSLLYTFKIIDTELKPPLVEIDRELSSVEISSITPGLFVDRRNDPVNPTRGSTTNVQLEYAFPFLSADSHEFAKLFAQRTAYFPLDRFGTLAASIRLGGIETVGSDNVIDPTVPEGVESRFVPISERFFGGGPSTHRAFRLDRLAIEGETAIDGAELGGNGLLLMNLDYRFPIAGELEGTVFFDTGNVWGDWRDIDIDEMRHGAGVGVRYLSPIGPLRVEVGWKLDRLPGESPREIFISFGHPF